MNAEHGNPLHTLEAISPRLWFGHTEYRGFRTTIRGGLEGYAYQVGFRA
jgi:hypothetical protein